MQAFFRTAQASSCRCSSCLQTATTIARRTTTAASRHRFRAGDLFTACYSTILATAAIVDAKVKDDRRLEWDRLIAEAKTTPIVKPEGEEGGSTGNISRNDREGFDEMKKPDSAVWDGISWSTATSSKHAQRLAQRKTLDAYNSVANSTRAPNVYSPSGVLVTEEEWIDEDYGHILRPREPRNHIQIRNVEETISKLVDRLLLQSKVNPSIQSSSLSAGARADLTAQMNEMSMTIEGLQRGDTPLPSYSHLDPTSMRQEQAELHGSLIALLKKAESDHSIIDVTLAKICCNLLVSTSPPNITTYNILIEYFTRLGRHDLAQIVVDSFLLESRYRPNNATICLLLNHFAAKGDSAGFRKIIKRMGGVDGDMRIKSRALSVLPVPSIQNWAMTSKVVHRNGLLTQKVPRNAQIFDSLIQGCLKLADIRSAIRYFRASLREGCQVNSGVLHQIAKACLEKMDYNAGRSLLYTILLPWEGGASLDHGIDYCSTSRYAIYQLLGLCRIDIASSEKLPIKASRHALQRLIRHMNIKSIADSVDRFSERVSLLESLLSMNSSEALAKELKTHDWVFQLLGSQRYPDTPYQRIDLAVRILNQASLHETRRIKRLKQNSSKARLKSIQGFEATLRTQSKDFNSIQQLLLPISYNHLSPKSKSKYDASVGNRQDIPISKRMSFLLSLHLQGGSSDKNTTKPRLLRLQGAYQSSAPEIQAKHIPKPHKVSGPSFSDSYPAFPRPASASQYQL